MENDDFQLETEPVEMDEVMSVEEHELRAETERMLDYAVGHGLCAPADALEWMIGFDACEKVEYKQNLVMILAEKCLPSGEELVDEYEEMSHSPYLSLARRQAFADEMRRASVHDREEILKAIRKEIEEKKQRYAVFNHLLLKIQVESLRKQLEQKFADADLAEAKRLIDQLSERTEKRERLAVVTPDVTEALDRVRQYIVKNDFGAARNLLNSIGSVLNFSGEYRILAQEIDRGEIALARARLKTA